MDAEFIKRRIAKLRTDSNISARELSLRLGQSTGYINTIENGKSLPSMSMFLCICEYFNITPKEFFDEDSEHPIILDEIIKESKKLDRKSLEGLLTIVQSMKKQ